MSKKEFFWLDLQRTFALEIGEELSQQFVDSLFSGCKGRPRTADSIYFSIGLAWSALIVHWRNWILKKSLFKPPVLIMRDAKPLTVAPISDSWPRVWLNRKICGIQDEISGDKESKIHPLLQEYLKQHSLKAPFTFVDSGCWGTVVKELHECIGIKFQPLFFFSHNPYIPGFLNELGVNPKYGEILNDSLECCFPNITTRPSSLIRMDRGEIVPELQKTDFLSVLLGKSALNGVYRGTGNEGKIFLNEFTMSPMDAVEHLIKLSDKAKGGEFTGILPYNSPTWSEGKRFLSDWPKELCWT